MAKLLSSPQIEKIVAKKKSGEKITMIAAYDYPFALLADRADADIILVGDSLANVVLGLEKTKDVTMDEMIHHAKAVRRAVKDALVVGDMPFESYQNDGKTAVLSAQRFIKEAGCDAVKMEWSDRCPLLTREIRAAGIPVMGHVGLTPQTAEQLGGLKVQGKDADSARRIIQNALELEAFGCFSMVLECVPAPLAKMITKKLSIPTIGIGAGVYCDGQVLVLHDILGLSTGKNPKFVKQYAHLYDQVLSAITNFREDVQTSRFPDAEHSYSMSPEELQKLTTHNED
ncbi:MAG: 3-methyl-2-oxobutanoate hydroxymethyltransferase [Candidatus Omnitrophica bacterium]|nr:3-methyl-2-oxobutanoate hydroxymethyltransferase [Candidatus Omnitrophota bacterium]